MLTYFQLPFLSGGKVETEKENEASDQKLYSEWHTKIWREGSGEME